MSDTMLATPRSGTGPRGTTAAAATDLLSVIVPVLHDGDDELTETYRAYRDALRRPAGTVEFVYVLATTMTRAQNALRALVASGEPLVIVTLSRSTGEATAVRSGFDHTRGDTILTLSAYPQVAPAALPDVLGALDECDLVVGRRQPLAGSTTDSVQAAVFRGLIRALFGRSFGDLVCRARACRRPVFEELTDYGTEPHFLPLLAAERGLRIREVDVRPWSAAAASRTSRLLARLQLAIDSLALFVVLKFVRKPLRLFSAVGLPLLLIGLAYTSVLAAARLLFDVPLADRPALILSVLLIVLGIQIIALGLIGEIIIFAAGKRIKDYTIEKIL